MTALRNFPDSPLAHRQHPPVAWKVPPFAIKVWDALHRFGQRRAIRELEMLADRHALRDPALARQLRATANEYRQTSRRPSTHA